MLLSLRCCILSGLRGDAVNYAAYAAAKEDFAAVAPVGRALTDSSIPQSQEQLYQGKRVKKRIAAERFSGKEKTMGDTFHRFLALCMCI